MHFGFLIGKAASVDPSLEHRRIAPGGNSLAGAFAFTMDELEAPLQDPAMADDGATEDEDDVSEPPADPVSVPGDFWRLGDHWLICGDSTSADSLNDYDK